MYEGSLCVSCMSTDDLLELFVSREVNNVEENYAKILTSCLNIRISEEDGHDSICESCRSRLLDCVIFKRQTLRTMRILSSVDITQLASVEDIQILGLEDHEDHKTIKCDMEVPVIESIEESPCNTSNSEKNQLDKELNGSIEELSPDPSDMPKPKRTVGRPRKHPRDNIPYKIGSDELICRECGEEFPNNVTLKVHYNSHFGGHACLACGKRFMKLQSLKKHETGHLIGPFACNTCRQEFSNINTLHSHKRYKHGTKKPFACRECDAQFATLQRRVAHEAAAHGRTERRYQCGYCEKRFAHSGQRARHIADRHEVKLFPCPVCGARYRRGYLRAHLLRVHGQGDGHECTVCGLLQPSRSTLTKHMLSHFDDRRFVCKLCGKAFVQKCSLKYHIGSHVRRGQYSGDPSYLMVYKEDSTAKDNGLLSEKDEDTDVQYLDESILSGVSFEDIVPQDNEDMVPHDNGDIVHPDTEDIDCQDTEDIDYQDTEDIGHHDTEDIGHQDTEASEHPSIDLTDGIEAIDGMLLDDERFMLPSDLEVP